MHQKRAQESNSLGDAKHERIAGGERGTGESVGTRRSEVSELRGWLILCPCGIFRSQNNYKDKEVSYVSTVFLVDLTISYKQVRLQTRSVAGFISPNKHITLVDAMAPWSPTD